jgi:diguanylate cyclase (GGDEF)-like protein/PAS domain S-box-containing protein
MVEYPGCELEVRGGAIGPEAYRALYEHNPDGVLFTAPDGTVFAANPAAREILGRAEEEIVALGRLGMADTTDERWGAMLADRQRTGQVRGIARMRRGDGELIEVEMSSQSFAEADGVLRTCTMIRDVTKRVAMERALEEMSAQLRELALTDDLTGLRNRRGLVAVGSHMLEVADRQRATVNMLFLDVDDMKSLNDEHGHEAGDEGLRAVAGALRSGLRRSDVLSRVGGDEFVALTLGLRKPARDLVERRIRRYLGSQAAVGAVGRDLQVSMGWVTRAPAESVTVEELMARADHDMYREKALSRSGGRSPGDC